MIFLSWCSNAQASKLCHDSYHLRQPLHCTAWIASDRPGLSRSWQELGSVHPLHRVHNGAIGFTYHPIASELR